MNISLTLCSKKAKGGTLNRHFKNIVRSEYANEAQLFFGEWFSSIDFKKSVLVCFGNTEITEKSILVSNHCDDIADFCDNYLEGNEYYDINFSVFEFSSYQEAFSYCKALCKASDFAGLTE